MKEAVDRQELRIQKSLVNDEEILEHMANRAAKRQL